MTGSRLANAAGRRARRVARMVVVLALSLSAALPSHVLTYAQAPDNRSGISPELAGKLVQRGDLTLKDTPLRDALLSISQQWNVNLVVAQDVEGAVNGSFKGAPLREILDSILLSNGYSYRAVGQSLVVMKIDKLGDTNPMFVTTTIPVRRSNPVDVLAGIKLLSSPQGKAQAMPSSQSILVVDYPDRIATIESFVAKLEQGAAQPAGPTQQGDESRIETLQFRPQYVDALDYEETVKSLLSPEGKLAIMPGEQKVIVTDHVSVLRVIERVLHELDMTRPQVRMTALIYDVGLDDIRELGVNWNQFIKGGTNSSTPSVFGVNSLMTLPAAAVSPAGAMTFTTISEHFDLRALITALDQKDNSRLLANPTIVSRDSEPVHILSVTEIPYQQLTQTGQGGNIGTTAFREAGVRLEVTPHVAEDGTISMAVMPSFSLLTGYTSGDQPQPIIARREAKTVVRVGNLQTLVIGGLRTRADITEENGIPFLKDIKYIGFLFRSKKTTVRESELIVFITPEIVTPMECLRPREAAASATGNGMLDQIPVAEPCPVIVNGEPVLNDGQPEPVPTPGEVLPPPGPDGVRVEPTAAQAATRPGHSVPVQSAPAQTPPANSGAKVRSVPPAASSGVRRLPPMPSASNSGLQTTRTNHEPASGPSFGPPPQAPFPTPAEMREAKRPNWTQKFSRS